MKQLAHSLCICPLAVTSISAGIVLLMVLVLAELVSNRKYEINNMKTKNIPLGPTFVAKWS